MISFFFRALTLFAIIVHTGFAANYTRPDGSKELFHLEKIPLQVSSMKEIANQLVIISRREQDESAVQRRASAQLLALAMRLDLTNKDARETDLAFSKGETLETSSNEEIIQAKSKLRFYKKWLASPDAGADANLLAGYMTDATKTLNPDTINNADTAQWAGILPPQRKNKNPSPPTDVADSTNTDKTDTPTPKPTPATKTGDIKFHLEKVSIKAPLKTDESKKYRDPKDNEEKYRTTTRFQITPLSVTFSSHTTGDAFEIAISSLEWLKEESQRKQRLSALTSPVITQLKARHQGLPAIRANVKIGLGAYSKFNYHSLTAPMAIMLESSLLNQPLRSDLVICASIDSKGNFYQPLNFWNLLKILRESETGGRLIVAPESAPLLTQLLVYGEPDFFTRWEVFTAKNIEQAMQVSVESSPGNVAEAHELFKSIQKLTQKSAVTKLAVNRAVRKRLFEIKSLTPNHLSSLTLLIQGGGKRPMRLSELALAHALLPTIKNIDKILSSHISSKLPKSSTLKTHHETFRADLDPLERLVDRSNEELYKETLKLVNDFRRLMALSRRISNSDSIDHNSLNKSATAIVFNMQKSCNLLLEQVNLIIYPEEKNEQ